MIGGLEPITSGKIIVARLEIIRQNNLQTYYRYIVGFVFLKLYVGREENDGRKSRNGS